MFRKFFTFVRDLYPNQTSISLHEPRFWGNEKKYVTDTIDSTFVSSVGEYVNKIESMIATQMGMPEGHAVAVVNGTSALHVALYASGVQSGDLVITQPLTFIATCNAIKYLGADPLFVDVEKKTLGLSPLKVAEYLETQCQKTSKGTIHIKTGRRVSACVPMHTFGHPVDMDSILDVCAKYNIEVIEDAAEALGSRYKGKNAGSCASLGILSFNGNKVVTTGGGGAVVARSKDMAKKIKHLTTTAKKPHRWAFDHDEMAFNYRMPNINAALGCAQLEQLNNFLIAKRKLADKYREFFMTFYRESVEFVSEPNGCESNYWLNTILLKDKAERDSFLEDAHREGILCRPAWNLMTKTAMYQNCIKGNISMSEELESRMVNIPSCVVREFMP